MPVSLLHTQRWSQLALERVTWNVPIPCCSAPSNTYNATRLILDSTTALPA